jgi:hypothetical protein
MGKSEYQKIISIKKKAKKDFFEKCYQEDPKTPLLVIFAPAQGEAKQNFYQLLEGILVLPIKVIVISDERGETVGCPTGKLTWVNSENGRLDDLIDEYLMAADMALVFDGHSHHLSQLLNKGVVVIGHDKSPMLADYHPNDESGNSFTFKSSSSWEIFRALVRAQETYRFPYDWENIIRSAVKSV